MSACRMCLALKPRKVITELCIQSNGASEGFKQIISFCLGIKIEDDLKVCSKLCTKCWNKLLEFHQFKSLALKNDYHWKSLTDNSSRLLEECTPKDDIKTEFDSVDEVIDNGFESDDMNNSQVIAIKEECEPEDDSDMKLSDVMNIKYEFIEHQEENDCVAIPSETTKEVKKRRGRPKSKVPKSKQDIKVGPLRVCEECGKTVRYLKEHMQRHLPKEKRKQIKCELCDKVFSSYQSHYKHKRKKHFSKKEECDVCHKSVLNLKQHKKRHNPELLKFVCALCERRFITKSLLIEHMTLHTKERPHECDQCPAKFRLKIVLQMHKRSVHDKERSHLCQYCPKSFFKKVHLQVHLRSHTKERPYSCPTCEKCFSNRKTLKNHLTVHSDEKSHSCTLCDMTFARRGYLLAHMKSHLKEKKFPCQYCSVRFHRSDHRKRHEQTAHHKHTDKLMAL